jgi:hypothetical protein
VRLFPKPETALLKIVKIDGRWHVIRSWHSDAGYELETLGDTLARSLTIEGTKGPIQLSDALLEAGWNPPQLTEEARLAGP